MGIPSINRKKQNMITFVFAGSWFSWIVNIIIFISEFILFLLLINKTRAVALYPHLAQPAQNVTHRSKFLPEIEEIYWITNQRDYNMSFYLLQCEELVTL